MNNLTKYFFAVLALSSSLVYSAEHLNDKLFHAIDSSNISNVKYYLEKGKNKITQEKKELFLKAARDVVIRKQYKLSIFSSGRDVLRLLIGSGIAGTGFAINCTSLLAVAGNEPEIALIGLAAGSSINLFGLYNMYKGWTLSSAYANLNKARQVEELIQDFKVESN